MRLLAGIPVLAAATALVVVLAGCSAKGEGANADPVKGKQLFVQRCGSCHVLSHAGTKGTIGPDLDAAFARARQDGFGTPAIRGIVYKQILFPNREGVMPADLVKGQDAQDVAAYVGRVAATPGKDTGALATVGQAQQKPLAKGANGKLAIPADPTGQLLYQYKNATAPAGALTIDSQNKSQTPHDISVVGKATGKVVKGGATSTINVNLTAREVHVRVHGARPCPGGHEGHPDDHGVRPSCAAIGCRVEVDPLADELVLLEQEEGHHAAGERLAGGREVAERPLVGALEDELDDHGVVGVMQRDELVALVRERGARGAEVLPHLLLAVEDLPVGMIS